MITSKTKWDFHIKLFLFKQLLLIKNYRILFLLTFVLCSNTSVGQNLSSVVMGTSNDQTKVNIVQTNSGDYIINSTVDATYDSCLIVKVDANLNTIWSKQLGFTGKNIRANKVFEKDNGNLLVPIVYYRNTISTNSGSSNLIEMDATGNFLGMDSLGIQHDRLQKIIKTADGNFINYGDLEGILSSWSIWNCPSLLKYDMSTGTPNWSKYYNYNPGGTTPIDGELYTQKMTESSSDSLYILADRGYVSGTPMSHRELRLIYLDNAGNHNWVKGYYTGLHDRSTDMIIDGDNNNYILGYSNGFGSSNDTDLFVLKVDPEGQVKWIKSYRNPYGGMYTSVIMDGGSNNLLIAGYVTGGIGNLGNEDGLLMELDTAGNLQWAKIYGDTLDEQILGMAMHPNGYLLAGTSNSSGFGGKDIYLVNPDINGDVVDTRCTDDITSEIIVTVETINTTALFYSSSTFPYPVTTPNIVSNNINLSDQDACECCCMVPTGVTDTICDGDSIIVNGNVYDSTGTYTDVLIDMNGCDSVVITSLTVLSNTVVSNSTTICDGDSIIIGNSIYYSTGTYFDTLVAANGCDSVVISNLTVLPTYTYSQIISLCDGQNISVGTNTYDSTGLYIDTLIAINGCDSTIRTDLTVLPNIAITNVLTICSGDSAMVGGNTYNTTGVFVDTFQAGNGCDSIVTTNLTVLPNSSNVQNISICNGDSYSIGGSTYNLTGSYVDTLIAANGCDSVVFTNLTVLPNTSSSQSFTICDGDSIVVGSNIYTSTGTYVDTFMAANGCDSIATNSLIVLPNSNLFQNIDICIGDSIVIGNNSYFTSGTYYDTLTAANGCDSMVTTVLSMLYDTVNYLDIDLCYGDSLLAGGSYQNTSGTYYDTLMAANGCDSVVVSNINVISVPLVIDGESSMHLCQNTTLTASGAHSYVWNTGATTASITESPEETQTYIVTGTDTMGCMATESITVDVVGEYNLYIPNTFSPSSDQMDNKKLYVFGTCIDSLELLIYDRWGGVVFETSKTDSRTSEDGDCCIFGSGWDGTFQNTGEPIKPGNFAYMIKGKYRNGESFFKTGNVILK